MGNFQKIIDVILSVIKSLFSTWIANFKANNPAGFRVVGVILVAIAGVAAWAISNGVLPQYAGIFEIVAYAAGGLAALFGITQLGAGAALQELAKSGDQVKAEAAHLRTVLLALLFVGGFALAVWIFTKNTAPQPAQPQVLTEGVSLPVPDPEADTAKPLVSYFVEILASRVDTVSSISTPGLPSIRAAVKNQYTISFFPVSLGHVPTLEDFKGKVVLKDGYELERVVNVLVWPNR